MPQHLSSPAHFPSAVLIGAVLPEQSPESVTEYLEELEFLAETYGINTLKQFRQKIRQADPATYIGRGKLEEIAAFINASQVKYAIFDDELSGSQARNLEKILKCEILDRTGLILNIFAKRALTSYAKVQVELAQYQYLLPRLTRMWTHLERQKGGVNLRGPGETELETDRRIIRQRISRLKEELAQIDKQMITQRKNRGKLVRVSLVGYTNVGKSTLMNLLSKSDVFAEDKLFATLDTTVRKVTIGNLPFLLSDTVGFIRKLPHALIESFKSTLDEVRESDVLVHVIDISHPAFEEQIATVNAILSDLNVSEVPVIHVFNKTDKIQVLFDKQTEEYEFTQKTVNGSWLKTSYPHSVFISARNRDQIPELKDRLYGIVKEIHAIRYPYNNFLY
jgi:GTP-binding protein HflX